MRPTLFIFRPQDGPAFELWAPREMEQRDAPENLGALVARESEGFAPNLVVGHDRVDADMSLAALITRLQSDAAELPGAEVRAQRTVGGASGQVRIVAFTHDGPAQSGPLYQMTACMLAPWPGPDGADRRPQQRHLIYLTGTCTVGQMQTWDPVFVDAAGSVRVD
jgi:hypothetical protein